MLQTLTKNHSSLDLWRELFPKGGSVVDFSSLQPMLNDIKTLKIDDLDLKRAALGVLRLQETYGLEVSSLAKGMISKSRRNAIIGKTL